MTVVSGRFSFKKSTISANKKKSVKTQDFQRLKILKIRLFIEPKTRFSYFGTKIQILNIQNHALLASKMGKIQTERKTSKVTRTSDVFLGFHFVFDKLSRKSLGLPHVM